MTREEAIQVLQTALTSPFIYGEYADAIGMAIEALSADRPTVKRCCVCGMPVATKRSYMTIAAKVCGESYVCSSCSKIIKMREEGE